MTPESGDEANNGSNTPKPNVLALIERKQRVLFAQRLHSRPNRNQHDQDTEVAAAAGVPEEASWSRSLAVGGEVAVPGGVTSSGAPISGSFRTIEPEAEHSR